MRNKNDNYRLETQIYLSEPKLPIDKTEKHQPTKKKKSLEITK